MSAQPNEAPAAAAPAPGPDQAAMLNGWVREVLSCTLRGAIASLPRVPGEIVLITACRAMGALVGQMYVGDEVTVSRFRKACRDGFKEGVNSVPVQPMPKQPDAPMTAMPKAS